MTDNFYNTIFLSGKELTDAQTKALTQEQKILRFFVQRGDGFAFGPTNVRDTLFDEKVPLTSIRRAMTDLTGRGDLVKLDVMTMGTYGQPEHLWMVSNKWNTAAPYQGSLL